MKVLNLLIISAVCVFGGCATPQPTRVQWEYKTIRLRGDFEAAEVQLNALAKEGWIVVDHSVISGAEGYTFVLKRPLK
jgi:hypothetical protein